MKNLLREHGYKATPARIAILDIFSKSDNPLSAKNVYRKIKNTKEGKNINEATVYRTISSLQESKILKKIDLRKDSAYFELAQEHHHHIICIKCEKVEDFENSKIEKLINRIVENSSKFKNIKEHSLELFGLCRVCA